MGFGGSNEVGDGWLMLSLHQVRWQTIAIPNHKIVLFW